MKYKDRYSIGEVSKICNISTKALRYYDKIGLIQSERDYSNNYRYYSRETLLVLPVIKYYKQMGFRLEEMRNYVGGSVYSNIKKSFREKIDELENEQECIRRKHISVRDWANLISEAELVLENDIRQVSVKYVESMELLFMDQFFENDIRDAVINVEFTNYVEQIDNAITGPVIINYTSYRDRMENTPQPVKILQRNIIPCKKKRLMWFGGKMMVSCYHIGPHEKIGGTYERICVWARENHYRLEEETFERYVTDYWTTSNSNLFVTEINIGISRV